MATFVPEISCTFTVVLRECLTSLLPRSHVQFHPFFKNSIYLDLHSFRSSLPVVSNLTAMNLWDFVCMIFIYASMLEFIVVNYLHRKIHHGHLHHHGQHNTSAASSRPASSEVPIHSIHHQKSHHLDHLQPNLTTSGKEAEIEVRTPLVVGEDPSTTTTVFSPPTQLTLRHPTTSSVNHQQQQLELQSQSYLRPSLTPIMTTSASPSPSPCPRTPLQGDGNTERIRAAASVFAWLRRPNIFQPQQETTRNARLARSIDHISKTVFPFLFGVFSFTFFAVFAGYLPSLLDEWIANEYRDE